MLSLDLLTSIFGSTTTGKKKKLTSENEDPTSVAGVPVSDSGSPQNPEIVNGWQHLTEPHPFAEQGANWQPATPFSPQEEAYWKTMFEPKDQGWTPYNQSFSTIEEAQLWEAKNPAPAPKPKPIGIPDYSDVDFNFLFDNYNMATGAVPNTGAKRKHYGGRYVRNYV